MRKSQIVVKGARVNNLKNIDVKIPRDKLVVITGLSGSGKSSLAFDTVFAEGHRRYVENLSAYARQFLAPSAKPDVDRIENLSPVIAIDQTSVNRSPRSTVGTMTEIYDYLRILFSVAGKPHCPRCAKALTQKSATRLAEEIIAQKHESGEGQLVIIAPFQAKGESVAEAVVQIKRMGYARVRNKEGRVVSISEIDTAEPAGGVWDIVVDRIGIGGNFRDKERLVDSIETAMKAGHGEVIVNFPGGKGDRRFNRRLVCPDCGVAMPEITPRLFSFNNPEGACPDCSGLGTKLEVDVDQVIPNRNLSVSEGALKPLGGLGLRGINGNFQRALEKVAQIHKFSLSTPVKNLPVQMLHIVLFGTNDSSGENAFEGIVPLLERKYREANSEYVRGEIEKYMIIKTCPACRGKRLRPESLAVKISGKSIHDICETGFENLDRELNGLFSAGKVSPGEKKLFDEVHGEIGKTIESLNLAGLGYLKLSRSANSLSGGEAQRVRLATQIGSGLTGIIFVLDEPSIGLHERDTKKLVEALQKLQREGGSVIIVEHDREVIKSADWVIDMGPGAGEDGGEVIFEGTPQKLRSSKSATGEYLSGRKKVFVKKKYRKGSGKKIEIIGASENNLKNINVRLPLGKFIVLAGVSGSGKSTLAEDILGKALRRHFWRAKDVPGKHVKISGLSNVSKIIDINQSPIGRTPRSNAATYTGIFSLIREIFSQTEEARKRAYGPSRFSFNVKGGRCEICQGEGKKKIEMHLLPDIYAPCEACGGTRFNAKTLEVEYQGVNIAQVLDMSVDYALRFFHRFPAVIEKLKTLSEVGLGYLKLGQSAMYLSGGEAQRIKLATELARRSNGQALYILDEPTVGLHFEDIAKLLAILDELVEKGNTVLVVEHNLDVLGAADWVVELGPEGGEAGGEVVFEGTPKELAKAKTWTGKYMR